MTRVGRVYGISSPDGVLRYVGSTEDAARTQKHRYNCKAGHLCCPFYRYAREHHGGLWWVYTIRRIDLSLRIAQVPGSKHGI